MGWTYYMGEGILLRAASVGPFEGLRSDGTWARVTSGGVREMTREAAEAQVCREGHDPSVLDAPPVEDGQ